MIALALVALAGLLTRDYWVPKPPVAMIATSDGKGTVSILWNSQAFADRDHASLIIEDGKGPLHTIHLNDKALRRGFFDWECKSGKMTATLLAGPISDTVTVNARKETYRPESGISK